MKNGKISESIYKRSVLKQLHTENELCVKSATVGEEFAATTDAVVSSQSFDLDLANKDIFAMVAVYRAINSVAATGAKLIGITASIMVPTIANEADFRELVKAIDAACGKAGVKLMQVNPVVTRACKTFVVTCTAIGETQKELIKASNLKPGMDIIATNYVGLEGTAILAIEKEEELKKRYTVPFINKAKMYVEYLPIISEAAVAVQSGADVMLSVSEGGIFASLWEMAEAAGVGLDIDLKKIPIRQETVEICEYFDINPYKLMSQGCLLIAGKDGNKIVREITGAGGEATIIGIATDSNDRVLIQGEERRFLETAQTDEIYKVIK